MSSLPTLISVSSTGENANDDSYVYTAAGNGRYVVFGSDATNLTSTDGGGRNNFMHDTVSGWTINIDISPSGDVSNYGDWRGIAYQNPSDPLEVAFTTSGFGDGFNLYLRDVSAGTTRLIAEDISKTDFPLYIGETWHVAHHSFSKDGTQIAYSSTNSSIVSNDTNWDADIFLQDLDSGAVTRVSVAEDGSEANGSSYNPRFSPDGSKVVFWSYANNLGPDDSNYYADVYIKDLATGDVTLVSSASDGSASNGDSVNRGFSSDGRYLLFESEASNLVEDDSNYDIDVFAYDLVTGETICVSRLADGTESNGNSVFSGFVPGTNIVKFITFANNLLADDTNYARDVVFTQLGSGEFETLDFNGPVQPNDDVLNTAISGDGNYAYLVTDATNLTPDDTSSTRSIVRVPLAQVLNSLQSHGTMGADVLRGNANSNYIVGKAGNDRIFGGLGDDYLQGDYGNDMINGGLGADKVLGGHGADTLYGYGGNDRLFGNVGNDRLFGGAGSDLLDGGLGADTMAGNLGNDTYIVNNAGDKVKELAGQGIDLVKSSVNFTLNNHSQYIENLTLTGNASLNGAGNMQNNTIKGNAAHNLLSGLNGNDKLYGFGGADTLRGGNGNDTLTGHNGNDTLVGNNGADNLFGGNGNDLLQGNAGADKLYGGAGADRLVGGWGRDLMSAGTDAVRDVFVFNVLADSRTGASHDVIFQFDSGEDKIDLSSIDANRAQAGNNAFAFSGSSAAANSVWYETDQSGAMVYSDVDGDAKADFQVELRGVAHLNASDFIL